MVVVLVVVVVVLVVLVVVVVRVVMAVSMVDMVVAVVELTLLEAVFFGVVEMPVVLFVVVQGRCMVVKESDKNLIRKSRSHINNFTTTHQAFEQ